MTPTILIPTFGAVTIESSHGFVSGFEDRVPDKFLQEKSYGQQKGYYY
ncbi:hypothetical protein [Pukyongia salina]|nr:hypothetical protein [Pukyongia salina]